ncbi:hypothetical protein STEG23_031872 [Scotinomys teguina]
MGGRGSGQSEAAGREEASPPGREDVELPMKFLNVDKFRSGKTQRKFGDAFEQQLSLGMRRATDAEGTPLDPPKTQGVY